MTDLAKMISIDGAVGEGGGQILRTALSLSLLTGKPFTLHSIRAGRKKAGLKRQHLVCVQAAATIGQAVVTGDQLDSTYLSFTPFTVQAGRYHFAIGSAGSTTLVLQTILPVLMRQAVASTVTIEGGTHNPFAPTAEFIQYGFLPALRSIGIETTVDCQQAGFFPAGGGCLHVTVAPVGPIVPLNLLERGRLVALRVMAGVQHLDPAIAQRELDTLSRLLSPLARAQGVQVECVPLSLPGQGVGNALAVLAVHARHTEVFTSLGERGKTAEQVARQLAARVSNYLEQPAAVDEYLTDQLLLPLALGQGGRFSSRLISEHTRTQAMTICQFLPDVQIGFRTMAAGTGLTEVTVRV